MSRMSELNATARNGLLPAEVCASRIGGGTAQSVGAGAGQSDGSDVDSWVRAERALQRGQQPGEVGGEAVVV